MSLLVPDAPSTRTTTGATPATDDVAGLGRVAQLVLRGDGLTTTSLEILTGRTITVRVLAHWVWGMSDGIDPGATPGAPGYTGVVPHDVAECARVAHRHLEPGPTERLLVRDILLVDDVGAVHGASTVVAALDRLDARVARVLATTDDPIGRTLRNHQVAVTRELSRWGLRPAGSRERDLPSVTSEAQRVPARDYVMRLVESRRPLAVFTEWFDPALFDGTAPHDTDRTGPRRPRRRHR